MKLGPPAVEPLIAALRDKGDAHDLVTDGLIEVLGTIGDPRAADVLKAQMAPGKGETTKSLARQALSKLHIQVEISADEIANLRDTLLSTDYDVRKTALVQARLVSSSIEDAAFQRAFQASEKLQMAFDHQREARSSTEPMQACQNAVGLEPGFSAAYVCLSYLHREYAKNLTDALTWAKKALEIDPQNMQAWTELGMVHVALRDVVGATRAFHKVVITQPQHANLEPDARLVAVYRKLGMQDHLGKAMLRLTNAGMGLDPDQEREWEHFVTLIDKEQLQKAMEEDH